MSSPKIKFNKKEKELISFLKEVAEQHGTTVRIAGGYIRDKLLCVESHDIDIAVDNMSGRAFAELYNKAQGGGSQLAVIEARPEQSKHLETAMLKVKGFDIDFAALRKETYADSRIPTVEPGTPEEDAKRRDLTANAMFYNIHTEEIEDYVGGYADLGNALATTPLDAKQTFLDDPLRILRCIRFCAKYDWEPSITVIEAANDSEVQEAFLNKISKERIWAEVIGQAEGEGWKAGFLTGPSPTLGMELVVLFGFMDILFSPRGIELNPWDTDQNSKHHDLSILNHTIKAFVEFNTCVGTLLSEEDIIVTSLSLILHDIGKRDPGCIQEKDDGTYSYLTHDDRSAELAEIVLEQLSAPKGIRERVVRLVKEHMRLHNLEDKPSKKSLRKIVRDLENDWLLLIKHSFADACGKVSVNIDDMANRYGSFIGLIKEVLDEQNGEVKIKRPINGHDLARLGVKKGPAMGIIFKALDEALLDNPEMDREMAELFVSYNFGEYIDHDITT